MTKIFVALLRLNHDLHAIDAASSSLVDVYTGVHRVDNPRGQTCELVCKAAPKLRACIRLEVLEALGQAAVDRALPCVQITGES